MTIKSWFLNKEFSVNERIAITGVEPTIEKETEKAVFLKWNTEYGILKKWIPKSCVEATAVANPVVQAMFDNLKNQTNDLYNTMSKGAKVKKCGGRKVFTIVSDISYDCVYVSDANGKEQKINIHNLQLA